MTKKQKQSLQRILISFVLFVILLVLEKTGTMDLIANRWLRMIPFLVPYLIVGYDVLRKAFINIRHGQVFDENFLMMIATFGAFGVQEYLEAVAVMLFYQVGELFQSYAVGKSRQSITAMMDIAPEYANLEKGGTLEEVDPDDVQIDDIIVIKAGERVPLDGIVTEGSSFVDTAALTGESVPRKVETGDQIISGCLNGSGTLKVRVTKAYEDSTVARILELVENASSKKAKMENFITRFAKYYTPIVTIGAVILAIVPPILLMLLAGAGVGVWADWIQRACTFLVISCPCALVISVPLGFFGGIGAASKIGVLVKGSNYLEAMAEVSTIVFDKTGTLTKGEFKVTQILPAEDAGKAGSIAANAENIGSTVQDTDNTEDNAQDKRKEALLEMAALGEAFSTHPIAQSIREAYGKKLDTDRVEEVKESAGHGLSALVDGRKVLLGNGTLLEQNGITYKKCESAGTVVYVAADGIYQGCIVISDTIKDGAAQAIGDMKAVGVKKTVMLTGDRKETAAAVASAIGIDEYHAELLPADKVSRVEALLQGRGDKDKVAFVGDGINDAPVLTRADIGIAMGSMGSDAAIEAADIVLMDDDVRKIAGVVKISRKTLRIVKQNVVFALGVKILVLLLGALGIANMWAAVFADVGVAVLAILNSMRTLNEKQS